MGDEKTLPMLDERALTPASAALLAAAERIVFLECCANGCALYDAAMGESPLRCDSLSPSARPPLDCMGFRSEGGDASC